MLLLKVNVEIGERLSRPFIESAFFVFEKQLLNIMKCNKSPLPAVSSRQQKAKHAAIAQCFCLNRESNGESESKSDKEMSLDMPE